jgi:hypothetical protein
LQGYVIGLALLVDGLPVIGAMGSPNEQNAPPIMVAATGKGLRFYTATAAEPVDFNPPRPAWAAPADAAAETSAAPQSGDNTVADPASATGPPPWLLSPQSAATACQPFGPNAPPDVICCGAMVKYFAVSVHMFSAPYFLTHFSRSLF